MKLNEKVILTKEGLKNLESELENLKTIKRKEIAEKIKVAMSFGDLSENSEYEEAKNEQAICETRIIEIESMLKKAQIIDEKNLSTDSVHIGSTVEFESLNDKKLYKYKIVGSSEADPKHSKISDESPVGSALLGHKIGEIFKVKAPSGSVEYKVLKISV